MANHLFIRNLNRCGQEISILERTLDESDFTSDQPVETFTELATPLAIVKTISTNFGHGTQLFDRINIVEGTTHIFCVVYDVALAGIEYQNHFIDLKTMRYKILAVTNVDEKDDMLIFQATQRGLSALEAAEA